MNQGGSRDPAFKRAKLNRQKDPKPLNAKHGEHLKEQVAVLTKENKRLDLIVFSQENKIAELEAKLIHKCQALNGNGVQCNEPAEQTTDWHGVEIFVCQQHSIQKKQ